MNWACERAGAGALVDPVTIQKLKSNPPENSFGEVSTGNDAWETHCEEWAEIHLSGGSESGQPTQQVGLREWRLRVRFHELTRTITPLMRVVLQDGEIINVIAAGDPDRQRRWIEITAGEKTT